MNASNDIQTAFLNVIAGNVDGDCLALANWNVEPVDVDDINCCIVAIRSSPDFFEWNVIYTERAWGLAIERLSADSLVVGLADGDLLRMKGKDVERIKLGIKGGIESIWSGAETGCWLAHESGLVHWDGKQLSGAVHTRMVFAIHGLRPDFAVAVGEAGLVLRFDGTTWHEAPSSPTNQTLNGVFCAAENEIYLTGWHGTLYRWDGQDRWKKIKVTGDDGALTSSLSGPVKFKDAVYVCAGALGLYKIDGAKSEHVQAFHADYASLIGDKLFVTGANCLAEFDGVDWAQTDIDLPA